MKCKRCGRDNPENAQRCIYCNAPLTNKPQNSKKGDKKLIGTIIALILVFACVAGTFAYQQFWPRKTGFRSAGGGTGGFGSISTGGGGGETIVAQNPVTIDGNDSEVEINFFTADKFDILVGSTQDVKFTAEVFSENELAPTDLVVTDGSDNTIGYMNDDGTDGDEKAGDGIYTLIASVNSNMKKALTYTLKAKDAVSNALKLFFYTDITAADFTFYKETVAKIVEINEPLSIQQLLVGNSGIKACTVSTDRKQVKIEFNSGITCVWEDDTTDGAQLKGTSPDGRVFYSDYTGVADEVRSANLSSAVSDGDVYVLRPYRSTDFQYDDFKTAGKILADTLGGEMVVRDDAKANLEAFKAFGDYGTILIDSHGKLDYDGNPAILTGVSYTSADSFSSADWQSKRLHVSISKTSGARVAIDGDFFDRYYADHSLDGASIYLGTC